MKLILSKIKSTQWSYENEYRLCNYNDENTGGTVVKKSYEELGLKVKAIYAGVQFENREALELVADNLQCELRQMTREPCKFALNVGGEHQERNFSNLPTKPLP